MTQEEVDAEIKAIRERVQKLRETADRLAKELKELEVELGVQK